MRDPYDLSRGDRLRELLIGFLGRRPPGMNPYTGKPVEVKKKGKKNA